MARPQKNSEQQRTVVVRVRFTASEKVTLEGAAQAAGLTISDFLRGRVLNTSPLMRKPTPDREALLKLLAELGRQGSNLNQISRALNRRSEAGELIGVSFADITQVVHNTEALKAQLRKLLDHGD